MRGEEKVRHKTNQNRDSQHCVQSLGFISDIGREENCLLKEKGDLHFDLQRRLTYLHHPAEIQFRLLSQ